MELAASASASMPASMSASMSVLSDAASVQKLT